MAIGAFNGHYQTRSRRLSLFTLRLLIRIGDQFAEGLFRFCSLTGADLYITWRKRGATLMKCCAKSKIIMSFSEIKNWLSGSSLSRWAIAQLGSIQERCEIAYGRSTANLIGLATIFDARFFHLCDHFFAALQQDTSYGSWHSNALVDSISCF
jgi:hypothetical protein